MSLEEEIKQWNDFKGNFQHNSRRAFLFRNGLKRKINGEKCPGDRIGSAHNTIRNQEGYFFFSNVIWLCCGPKTTLENQTWPPMINNGFTFVLLDWTVTERWGKLGIEWLFYRVWIPEQLWIPLVVLMPLIGRLPPPHFPCRLLKTDTLCSLGRLQLRDWRRRPANAGATPVSPCPQI